MDQSSLKNTIKSIFSQKRGVLAADERPDTLGKRFLPLGIENTPENRFRFRELLFKTRFLEKYIGGVILNEETYHQVDSNGKFLYESLIDKGIAVGIKMDKGLGKSDGENNVPEGISMGIEDLESRILNFPKSSFTKWRALFKIDENFNEEFIQKNVQILSRFAKISQMHSKVPIVEPEIFYDGFYDISRMMDCAENLYKKLYLQMKYDEVYIEGVIMKLSFITPGMKNGEIYDLSGLAIDNISVISRTFTDELQQIVFLSGGHSSEESKVLLSAINRANTSDRIFSFSFGRAIGEPVLDIWRGKKENVNEARKTLLKVCRGFQEALERDGK